MAERDISKAVIDRLPRYFRYLGELRDSNVERISSLELSRIMKVTASQIRQDFNHFGGFGQQGYGYNVDYLYNEIGHILGLDKTHEMILIGAGNLGSALANYMNFERRGFVFNAIFDQNPALYGKKIRDLEVRPMEELADFVHTHNVDIAVLAIPKTSAINVAAQLTDAGIKAIWNFAHVDLAVSDDVLVENVHLSDSLMRLSYRFERQNTDNEEE